MPRAPLPPSKSKKSKKSAASATPTTPEEFLALAVSHEESAEKWRAGDAVKSARFYGRALTTYSQALSTLRLSTDDTFDFEYNRARVLLTLAESKGLLQAWDKINAEFAHLQLNATDEEGMLRVALEGFRRSLSIKEDKDALFNIGQALSSLADVLGEGREDEARLLLKESVELLEKCLGLQEASLAASRELVASWKSEEHDRSGDAEQPERDDVDTDDASTGSNSGDQWASVQEPVTATTLIETGLALMEVLEKLVDLADGDQSILGVTENLTNSLIKEKLPAYVAEAPDSSIEIAVASARLQAGLLEAAFRSGRLDMGTYWDALKDIYETGNGNARSTAEWLVGYSEALTDFSTAVGLSSPLKEALEATAMQRWNRLSKALELLTQASKHDQVRDVARVHLGRGDIEVMRLMLTREGALPGNLSSDNVQATLVKNAGTYYRGAANLAQAKIGSLTGAGSSEIETWRSAAVRGAVVGGFAGLLASSGSTHQLLLNGQELRSKGIDEQGILGEIRRMVEESVLSDEAAKQLVVK